MRNSLYDPEIKDKQKGQRDDGCPAISSSLGSLILFNYLSNSIRYELSLLPLYKLEN